MKLSVDQLQQAFEIESDRIDLASSSRHIAAGFALFYAVMNDGIDAKDALRLLIKQPQSLIKILEMLHDSDTADVREVIAEYRPIETDDAQGIMTMMAWASMQAISQIAFPGRFSAVR